MPREQCHDDRLSCELPSHHLLSLRAQQPDLLHQCRLWRHRFLLAHPPLRCSVPSAEAPRSPRLGRSPGAGRGIVNTRWRPGLRHVVSIRCHVFCVGLLPLTVVQPEPELSVFQSCMPARCQGIPCQTARPNFLQLQLISLM